MSWACDYARPGDDLHLVAAYRELAVSGMRWFPALRAADAHRDEVRNAMARVAADGRRQVPDRVDFGVSVVATDRAELIRDAVCVADLVVTGVPATAPDRPAVGEAKRLVRGFPDVSAHRGVLVLVPERHELESAIVVVPVHGADLAGEVLDVSAAAASRRDGQVRVISSWAPERSPDVDLEAARRDHTVALEHRLFEWAQQRGPESCPSVVVEVVRTSMSTELGGIGGSFGLVVIGNGRGHSAHDYIEDAAVIAMERFAVPLMVVNSAHHGAGGPGQSPGSGQTHVAAARRR
ncbi:MAG TPA: hypothetical protein VGH43_03005 [Jatrophihabitans sp.]